MSTFLATTSHAIHASLTARNDLSGSLDWFRSRSRAWVFNAAPLLVALGLHAALLASLMLHHGARTQIQPTLAPIIVSMLSVAPAVIRHRDTKPVERVAARPVTTAPTDSVPAEPEPQTEPASAPVPTRAAAEPVSAVVTPPNFNAAYLDNPAPRYPSLSRRAGEQGLVLLRVFVDTAGHAQTVEMKHSSGYERLDVTAIEAVRQWRFEPAKRGTESIPAWVLVPISFKLEG